MFQIVTLPHWQCRTPVSFSRRGEHYWTCAELPLGQAWVFVVNTAADPKSQLAARSVVVVSAEQLLDVLAELGPDRVKSVYQIHRGTADDDDALVINRLCAIDVGEDSHDGWRKVFMFQADDGVRWADERDFDAVERIVNRVEVAAFRAPAARGDDNGSGAPKAPSMQDL
ncbi:hypothetical protein [Piscinibacter terrae]|uniref:Uncharacterized protein n=1 Tax=Piscinibacter terrae TaxID=2496871 RepID=A0A3N7ISF6_9BURK|nr:hypothetical protein [Albitalea terrae]RQP21782.1 hypothetical protein DZC73_25395 [Albitalea terrae]